MQTQFSVVFPGQGSQFVGMLLDVANEYPEVTQTFMRASQILGYDLWELTQKGPTEELDKTVHTQPALLAASYALWQILQRQSHLKPTILAGHSLGEYTALVAAESLTFEDGIRIVAARGEYMQEAVPVGQGALAAIVGLEDAAVTTLCKEAALNEVLSPVNYNSIGQVVIGGTKTAVERAISLAKAKSAKLAKILPVSVPSHCILMKPAAVKLSNLLSTVQINPPKIPVLNNVDVVLYNTAEQIRDGLVRQLYNPVRWVETIEYFSCNGIQHIIECGPGKVLNGLNKRITNTIQLTNVNDLASLVALRGIYDVAKG